MSGIMDKISAAGGTMGNKAQDTKSQAAIRMQQMKEQQEQRSANEE